MSDMSVNAINTADSVNFGRRRHRNRNNRMQGANNNAQSSPFIKLLEAGIAVGGGMYAKHTLAAPTADEVVLYMNDAKNAKAYNELSVVDSIVASLKKEEGATLSDASKKALKKIGVEIPDGKRPLEFLTDWAKTHRNAVEANDRRVISTKLTAIDTYEKFEKSFSETPADKQTGKLFETAEKAFVNMKKMMAKLFHLETDKDGKVIGDIDTKSLKNAVEKQSEKLSKELINEKKRVADKISNIKLLDINDPVAKAYKSIKDSKSLKGYGAVAAAVLAAAALIFPSLQKSSNKA